MNAMPPNRFKYTIEHLTGELELTADPKGWDEHQIGFQRSDDFGLNIENVVPLSFAKAGKSLIGGLYKTNGIFAHSKVRIDRRQNDWTYAEYYKYKHDYSTYRGNRSLVEISGIEDGLAKKFDTYKDTEYEIDLPETAGKTYIDYTGANYTTSNQVQAGYGKLEGDEYYILKGSRAVRAYNNKIAFTDAEGLPYETMTIRAIETVTFQLKLVLKITIEADALLFQLTPDSGTLQLVKQDANFQNATLLTPDSLVPSVTYPFQPDSTATPVNNRVDTFDKTVLATVTLNAGELLSLYYRADATKAYDKISIVDGAGCYMEISNEVESAYQNAKLEAFTYEWLIEKLLLKIDSTATFASTVTYPNVREFVSCTPCVRNLGKTSGEGKIKTTLKDVLESFNKLKCIAIDITGSAMTISDRDSVYLDATTYGTITSNNISVKHDISHQYNKITVGADTNDRKEEDPLTYPFICKKEFSIGGTLADSELNLVNNFMLDPYAIDKYIIDTLGKSDNKDECKFMVFAVKGAALFAYLPSGSSIDTHGYGYVASEVVNVVTLGTDSKLSRVLVFAETNPRIVKSATHLFSFTSAATEEYAFTVNIKTSTPGGMSNITREFDLPSGFSLVYSSMEGISEAETLILLKFKGIMTSGSTLNFDFAIRILENIVGLDILDANITVESPRALYRGHDKPIIGFKGDSDTIYNIPLTPKRILDRWKRYLAVSLVGADAKRINYGTSTILNSSIASKCDYESAVVVENSDLWLTGVTPLFLPSIIEFDTSTSEVDIDNFEENKYNHISVVDEKNKETYVGWINSATFAVAKQKSQKWELQAKTI